MIINTINLLNIKDKKVKFEKIVDNSYDEGMIFLFLYYNSYSEKSLRIVSSYDNNYTKNVVESNKDIINKLFNLNINICNVEYVKLSKNRTDAVKECMKYFENGGVIKYLNSEFYRVNKDKLVDNIVDIKYYYEDDKYELISGFICDIDNENNLATVIIATNSFFDDSIKPGLFLNIKIDNNELVI